MGRGIPVLVQDIDRLRGSLNISAFGRARVIIEGDDSNLRMDLECVACEELLVWNPELSWWLCPVCQQETTGQEGIDLLRACYRGLGEVLGEGEDTDAAPEEGGGDRVGRWLKRLTLSNL